jgi:APA family basic amino acid/polyamine antiporter
MIGSGIFIAPSIMAGYVQNASTVVLLWIIAGVFTLIGALSFGELAAAMPKSGGQYVFLSEAYCPLFGFLYGWALFLVIQNGMIAAVAIAFAKYMGVFIPWLSEQEKLITLPIGAHSFSVNSVQVTGMLMIMILVFINCLGIKIGAAIQNVFTGLKAGALLLLVVLGFAIGSGSFSHFTPFLKPSVPTTLDIGLFALMAVALSKALFSYDSWYSASFTADEVHNPSRNLPLSLFLGTVIVVAIYSLATTVYFYIIPWSQAAQIQDNRIAAAVAQAILGAAGLYFITMAILISTSGCNNGMILSGARVYYAMAKDQLFFKKLAEIHPKYRTPIPALIAQGIWACILTLTGTYSDLLTYSAFGSVLFNGMTVFGIFILRKKRPDLPRPFKAWGYPWSSGAFILVALGFVIFIILGDPLNSLKGLVIMLMGIPVYLWFRRSRNRREIQTAV